MKYTIREYIAFPFAYLAIFLMWLTDKIAGDEEE